MRPKDSRSRSCVIGEGLLRRGIGAGGQDRVVVMLGKRRLPLQPKVVRNQ